MEGTVQFLPRRHLRSMRRTLAFTLEAKRSNRIAPGSGECAARGVGAVAMWNPGLAWLAVALLLPACGKSPDAAATASSGTAPPNTASSSSSPASDAHIDAEIARTLSTPPAAPEAPASSLETALASQAEDILSRHPDKNALELLNVPEVNEKLRTALQKLGADKSLQQRINATVELAARFKGLDGPPGFAKLDLDVKGYDRSRKGRMLQAVISGDPRRIVDFLVGEIGEATPELSLGGAERAANGVAITPQPQPAPPQ